MLERSHLKMSKSEPLLVFTMAKVGSSSVYNSVKRASAIPAFHIHSLDEQEVQRANQRCFDEGIYPDSQSPVHFIRRDIIKSKRKYKVISLFRNPVERNLSAFFDAFRLMVGTPAEHYQGTLDDLVKIFYAKINHDYASHWYSDFFLPGIDVDVYQHSFDKVLGYNRIESEKCSVLLMNSAIDDSVKESVIADFLALPAFKLTNANVRAASKEAGLYQLFKSHISLDKQYLSRVLDTQYFKHFFSGEDKEQTFEKWLK